MEPAIRCDMKITILKIAFVYTILVLIMQFCNGCICNVTIGYT